MSKLERLVYGSTATGSTDSLLNLATILAESQRNNARDGLTGALAAHQGHYIQVIEGTPTAVDRLLLRLEQDDRHRTVVVLDRRAVAERRFGDWEMANARITPELRTTLDALMGGHPPSADQIVDLMERAVARMQAGGEPHPPGTGD